MSSNYGYEDRLRLLESNHGTVKDMVYVGWCLLHGVDSDRNIEAGLDWYRRAALAGDIEAKVRLAEIYEVGEFIDIDCLESEKWYEDALKDVGSFMGYYARAISYDIGSHCVKRDLSKALFHYKHASNAGHIVSQLQYARILRSGTFGRLPVVKGWVVALGAFCKMVWIIVSRQDGDRLWDAQRWIKSGRFVDQLRKGTRFE